MIYICRIGAYAHGILLELSLAEIDMKLVLSASRMLLQGAAHSMQKYHQLAFLLSATMYISRDSRRVALGCIQATFLKCLLRSFARSSEPSPCSSLATRCPSGSSSPCFGRLPSSPGSSSGAHHSSA